MSINYTQWVDKTGQRRLRIMIGHLRQNLYPAYYEPVGEVYQDRGPEIGIFHDKREYKSAAKQPAAGSFESWSLSPTDIYWFPWALPFTGENTSIKGREIIQRRDLYDFWAYLFATDPKEVAERAKGLNAPGHTRRLSFYRQAAPLKRREMKAKEMGVRTQDLELADFEDEGFEVDDTEQEETLLSRKRKGGEMPPPPPGGISNKKQRRSGGRDDKLPKYQPGMNDTFLDGLFRSAAGGLGNSRASSSRGRSPSVVNGRDTREGSFASLMDTRDPSEHNNPRRSSRVGSPLNYVQPMVETVVDGSDEQTQSQRDLFEAYNGSGTDEDAAYERAIRESTAQAQQKDLTNFGSQFKDSAYGTGQLPSAQIKARQSQESIDFAAMYNGGLGGKAAVDRAILASTESEAVRARGHTPSNEELNEMAGLNQFPSQPRPTTGRPVSSDHGNAEARNDDGDVTGANGSPVAQREREREQSNDQQSAGAANPGVDSAGSAGAASQAEQGESGDGGGIETTANGGGDGESEASGENRTDGQQKDPKSEKEEQET